MAPETRTLERLRHHYEVERELGDRLRRASRDERRALYATLYDELFARVPDHPRLTCQETPAEIAAAVQRRMRLLAPLLPGTECFLEFAPGDCRLALEVCRHVPRVIAADISDQIRGDVARPPNFEQVIYDGYDLPLADGTADLAFSYQFIEHLHPEDTELHLRTAYRVLRPGGRYVLSTPHRYSGPHDVSVYFSTEPRGFHLKEWTYGELRRALLGVGFRACAFYSRGRPRPGGLATRAILGVEAVLGVLPHRWRRRLCRWQYESVILVATR